MSGGKYLGTALEGVLSAVWDEAEALALWERTDPDLREGDPATAFTVWARGKDRPVRLAPLTFTRIGHDAA